MRSDLPTEVLHPDHTRYMRHEKLPDDPCYGARRLDRPGVEFRRCRDFPGYCVGSDGTVWAHCSVTIDSVEWQGWRRVNTSAPRVTLSYGKKGWRSTWSRLLVDLLATEFGAEIALRFDKRKHSRRRK